METLTIYHNSRCSKSRTALAILQAHEVPLRVVEYLKDPPTRAELATLRRKLGRAPAEWIRKNEAEFKQAGLSANSSEEQLLDAMAKHPILIERPIVVCGNRAVVGRPPERVLELLEKN
ncbi:MAG: arsenate reductase (glutaredoxin) [Candidatus Binatia bacterium]